MIPHPAITDPPHRIFVKGLNWVGDAIMATPALAHLRRCFPRAEITLMVRPWVAAVYEHNPDIDHLWVHDDAASLKSFLAAVARIRRSRFDWGIALTNSPRSAALLRLGGIPRRIGFNRGGRRWMLTDPVTLDPELLTLHQVYYYLGILEPFCGAPHQPVEQKLVVGDIERQEIDRLLRQTGLDHGRLLIGLAPGSINSTAKRWPADRFAAVAQRLIEQHNAEVLLLGSPKEHEVLQRVAAQCRHPLHDMTGKTGLSQAIALFDRLDGLVTNDAGGMHIAAALKVPTIAIFGPTEWTCTYPFSPNAKIVRKEGVPCAPCMLRECPIEGHPCMTEVTIDMVYDQLISLLEKTGKL